MIKNMSNICDNTFFAYSDDPQNLEVIKDFFENQYEADLEECDNSIDCYFESKWVFPEVDMDNLYKKIPKKSDIYMRCLSVEYGCLYHALWVCNEDGWEEV